MSLLAATARRARLVQPSSPLRLCRRGLGDTVTGPPISDLSANFKLATEFFTKSPTTYGEFKQQCISLRLFAFAGLNAAVVLSLMMDPPKSSYWVRMSPTYIFSFLKSTFLAGSPPVFLTEKAEGADVPAIVNQLTSMRRLDNAGSDSEEE
mmetsp:Transcript_15247/g.34584  ORF Transcript_15247/g.34584 Transcript_15247/m.34584 type:complete len:151 (-) Transcript_15247:186-638(-)